jgi:hypothetical protein
VTLYALEDLDDALAVTREFLTPIDRTTWVKLAVVAFFISGPGANVNGFQYSFGGDGGGNGAPPPDGMILPDLGGPEVLVIGLIFGIVLLLALVLGLVGAVMEFVFVESLRDEEVRIREYWSRRWRQGLRLFVFRALLGVLVFVSVLLLVAPLLLPFVDVAVGGGLAAALLLFLVPLFVVLAVVVGVVNGFTTVFVVPIMILEDRAVLDGWRRLWPTITSQWTQYLAYAVAAFFLSILGGILASIVTGVLAVILLVPFGLLFGVGIALLVFLSEIVGGAVLVVVGILFGLAVLVVAALVQVPIQTYLRYYALLVLGDIEPEFDLVPEQRAAVRESSEESSAGGTAS